MSATVSAAPERVTCTACGGAGGGPFGPSGSAWDDEEYVCPRCEGAGMIVLAPPAPDAIPRPGLVKATPLQEQERAEIEERNRKATG